MLMNHVNFLLVYRRQLLQTIQVSVVVSHVTSVEYSELTLFIVRMKVWTLYVISHKSL